MVKGIGQMAFILGHHVVHNIWSQEFFVNQLKTLPTDTRRVIWNDISPGLCSGKKSYKLVPRSFPVYHVWIHKRARRFYLLWVNSSHRLKKWGTRNHFLIKCGIISRRGVTLIFLHCFWPDYVLDWYSVDPTNLTEILTYTLHILGPIICVDFRCRFRVSMFFFVFCCFASSRTSVRLNWATGTSLETCSWCFT